MKRISSRTPSGTRKRSEAGFTLLEMTVSLLIFAFALTGLASLTKSNIRADAQARYLAVAGDLAQQKLEDLRAGGYTAAASSTSNETLNESGGTTGTTLFTRSWTVATGSLANTKTLTATVSWTDVYGTHSVQMTSILGQ
jgi:prepilin-type N-terminal cleavage/methylation domain-containing protein